MEHSLQYSAASLSSHPSHTTWLGSAKRLPTEDELEEEAAVASTVEAKWLTGRDEAEMAVAVVVAVCLPFTFLPRPFSTAAAAGTTTTAVAVVGISKTARHTGHL